MELITTMKQLEAKLSGYGISAETEQVLREYCRFLASREDLLELAQCYHDDIFENGRYSLLEVEQLPEQDGREQGLLFAVMFFARWEQLDAVLAERGIPAKYKAGALSTLVRQLEKSGQYYGSCGFNGMYRSRMVGWLEPNQFTLGRLTFQISTFGGAYAVYRSRKDGTLVPLALPGFAYLPNGKRAPAKYEGQTFVPELREDAETVCGCTFDGEGVLLQTPVLLKTGDYEKVLQPGDAVINVHIPPTGRLDEAAADEAFAQAKAFFARYYPELRFRAWVCSSWLLDTGLKEVLKPDSNILRFQSRFRVVLGAVNGFSLYWHIFDVEQFLPLDALTPRNSFQEKMLERVRSGKSIYSGYGFILRDAEE